MERVDETLGTLAKTINALNKERREEEGNTENI